MSVATADVVGRVRARDEMVAHSTFLSGLVERMSQCVNVNQSTGDSRNVSQKVLGTNNALDARFELGKSDQHYLMATVMPLHSTDNDTRRLHPSGLYPEVERAGNLGMVLALQTELKTQYEEQTTRMESVVRLLEWMFELVEIRDFVEARLSNPECDHPLAADAVKYVTNMAKPEAMVNALRDDMRDEGTGRAMGVICLLLETLLLVYTKPMEKSEEQYQRTVVKGGVDLRNALERLARGSALSSEARDLVGIATPAAASAAVQPGSTAIGAALGSSGFRVRSIGAPGDGTALITYGVGAGLIALFGKDAPAPQLDMYRGSYENYNMLTKTKLFNVLNDNFTNPETRSEFLKNLRNGKLLEWLMEQTSEILPGTQITREEGNATITWFLVNNTEATQNERAVDDERIALLQSIKSNVLKMVEADASFDNKTFLGSNDGVLQRARKLWIEDKTPGMRPWMRRQVAVYLDGISKQGDLDDNYLDLNQAELDAARARGEESKLRERSLEREERNRVEEETLRQKSSAMNETRRAERQAQAPTERANRAFDAAAAIAIVGLTAGYMRWYARRRGRNNVPAVNGGEQNGDGGEADRAEAAVQTTTGPPAYFAPLPSPSPIDNANGGDDSDDDDDDVPALLNGGHCDPPFSIIDDQQRNQALNGLAVGAFLLSEQSEDWIEEKLNNMSIRRESGVSPLWNAHSRKRADLPQSDWWSRELWSRVDGPSVDIGQIAAELNSGKARQVPSERLRSSTATNVSAADVEYAIARGLCGARGPLQPHPENETVATSLADSINFSRVPTAPIKKLVYAMPTNAYVGPDTTPSFEDATLARIVQTSERAFVRDAAIPTIDDFVVIESIDTVKNPLQPPTKERYDDAHIAQWLPAKAKDYTQLKPTVGEQTVVETTPQNLDSQVQCRAAIYEHQIDYYATIATVGRRSDRELALAMRAAVKIKQLKCMHHLAQGRKEGRTIGLPDASPNGGKTVYVTRPCVRCEDGRVLYPVDTGLGAFTLPDASYLDVFRAARRADGKRCLWLPTEKPEMGEGEMAVAERAELSHRMKFGPLQVISNTEITYGEATVGMRSAVTQEQEVLYAAPPVEYERVVSTGVRRGQPRRQWTPLPDDPNLLSVDSTRAMLLHGLETCERLKAMAHEREYLRLKTEELRGSQPPDADEALARQRRGVIFNDALREAAISGDRLWSFARQLSGTIAEPVDNVCVVDETALQRQQMEARDQRRQIANRTAETYMQIVRSIFAASLSDSGLRIGIDDANGGFKVLNTTLQKKAQELSNRPEGNGFFANGIQLQELLATGRGSITIDELFQQLGEVGRALQVSAEAFLPMERGTGQASLEFLRAPRNCLFLQWKDETRAGIRRAFDLFGTEMRHHGYVPRHILAYELVEGSDATLCNAFAEFCGQFIAMTRMHNPSHAVYVSDRAATVAANKTKIALNRLATTAYEYAMRTGPPGDSRSAYFDGLGPRVMAAPVQPRLTYKGGWRVYPIPRMGLR
jgi:hypothetical protein